MPELEEARTSLLRAAIDAREHMQELAEAWERGAISEHDGQGERRSNRNAECLRAIRGALKDYYESKVS